MAKKIFMAFPSERCIRELSMLKDSVPYDIIFDSCSYDQLQHQLCQQPDASSLITIMKRIIDKRVSFCKRQGVAGVVNSRDYPGNPLAVLIAQHLGLPGPDLAHIIALNHKYYSRLLQKQFVPDVVPNFALVGFDGNGIDTISLPCPFFIKPVKANFSQGAFCVTHKKHINNLLSQLNFPSLFHVPFDYLIATYTSLQHDSQFMIAESLLQGVQGSVEGFVSDNEVTVMGIVDAIMYPGTFSFKQFEYPSRLPCSVQKRLRAMTKKLIRGIGLDNTLFNIEFMYNPRTDALGIIEINPRMASQFADLFEKVDGINSYQILLDIAAGTKPKFEHGNGNYAHATSFTLRTFQNMQVVALPSQEDIERIIQAVPDTRIEIDARLGVPLGNLRQDTSSYRYAVLNIGADSRSELLDRYEKCKRMLNITLAPVSNS